MMFSITGDAALLQLVFPRRRLPQFGKRRPARHQRHAGHRQPQQPPPNWPFDIFMPLALP